ncbi:MAG: biopolymer transporter ExbD [Phormidesmis sp.]
MRLPEEADSPRSGVNILPMIDVIFAILAFFVLSTLYLSRAEGLPVNLPQAVTATPQNQVSLTLTITPAGDLFLNDEAIALENLTEEVRAIASEQPILVTIRADETTRHGSVIAAMDQLRQVDGVKIGIATVRP